eukprot:scaffold40276_cov31-Tisochrysis_lutea.AAC.1
MTASSHSPRPLKLPSTSSPSRNGVPGGGKGTCLRITSPGPALGLRMRLAGTPSSISPSSTYSSAWQPSGCTATITACSHSPSPLKLASTLSPGKKSPVSIRAAFEQPCSPCDGAGRLASLSFAAMAAAAIGA